MKRKGSVSDQLRQAIEESGCTRYRIAKETGVDEGALSRFVRGERGLTLAAADKLCKYLNLRLVEDERKGR